MQKNIRSLNKQGAIQKWRMHVKRWRVLKRVLMMNQRMAKGQVISTWLKAVCEARGRSMEKKLALESVKSISELSKRYIVLNTLFSTGQRKLLNRKLRAFLTWRK